jgi:hypothetical protein
MRARACGPAAAQRGCWGGAQGRGGAARLPGQARRGGGGANGRGRGAGRGCVRVWWRRSNGYKRSHESQTLEGVEEKNIPEDV